MKQKNQPIKGSSLRFGGFLLIRRDRELWYRGKRLPVSSQPLEILDCLAGKLGAVVTRQELKTRLWPNAGALDTDRRLNTAVLALRTVLDSPGFNSIKVQTIRGSGYRLIVKRKPVRVSFRFAGAMLTLLVILWAATPVLDPSTSISGADPQVNIQPMLGYLGVVQSYSEDKDLSVEDRQDLAALVGDFPKFLPLRLLEARMSVDDWRRHPSAETLNSAQVTLTSLLVEAPNNSDVYALLGELALYGDWDWVGSERYLKKALEANQSHAHARRILAWLYVSSERPSDAWAQLGVLLTNGELDPEANADLGWLLLRLGENRLALSICQGSRFEPRVRVNLLSCQHTAHARMKNMLQAHDIAIRLMGELDAQPNQISAIAAETPEAGYARFLRWRVERFPAAENSWFVHAQLLAEAGFYNEAEAELERAFNTRDPRLVKLHSTPEFAGLIQRPSIRAIWVAVRHGRPLKREIDGSEVI